MFFFEVEGHMQKLRQDEIRAKESLCYLCRRPFNIASWKCRVTCYLCPKSLPDSPTGLNRVKADSESWSQDVWLRESSLYNGSHHERTPSGRMRAGLVRLNKLTSHVHGKHMKTVVNKQMTQTVCCSSTFGMVLSLAESINLASPLSFLLDGVQRKDDSLRSYHYDTKSIIYIVCMSQTDHAAPGVKGGDGTQMTFSSTMCLHKILKY